MPPAEYDSEATRLTAVLHRTRTHGVTAGPCPAGPGAGPASVRTAAAAALRPPWLSGPAAVTTQPGPDLSLPSAGAGQADGVCGVTIEGPDLPGSQAHPASYRTQCDVASCGARLWCAACLWLGRAGSGGADSYIWHLAVPPWEALLAADGAGPLAPGPAVRTTALFADSRWSGASRGDTSWASFVHFEEREASDGRRGRYQR